MSRRTSLGVFVVAGLAVALALAFVVAPHASSAPDGLSKVAIDQHLDTGQQQHALADGPLAGYAVPGIHGGLATGLAGVAGVAVTFAIALGLTALLRVGRRRNAVDDAPSVPSV